MLKNRIIPAFALAGLIGIAACEQRDDVRVDETQEVPPPATVEPVTSPAEPLRAPEDTLMYQEGVPQEQDPAAPGAPGEPGAPRIP